MPKTWTGGTPAVLVRNGVEDRLVMSRSGGGPPVTAWTVDEIRAFSAFLTAYLWDLDEEGRQQRMARTPT